MVNEQLLDYIKQQTQQGVAKEQIKNSLLSSGWLAPDVEEAFNLLFSPNQITTPAGLPSQSLPQEMHKGINKTLLAFVLVIGVLIVGGGAFASYNYFQSPEKRVEKMLTKSVDIKSSEFLGEIKVEFDATSLLGANASQPMPTSSNKKTVNLLINFTGFSDIQDLSNPKGQFSFNLTTDALPQGQLAFGLEIKVIDKTMYVKLNNPPNLGFLDLTSLKDQWIKIDIETIQKQYESGTSNNINLSPEQIKQIKTAVGQSKVFKITEKLASEKVNDVDTYHYKFTLDKEGVKKLLVEIGKIIQKPLTEKDITSLDKDFETIELPEGEIWIGKGDSFLYKISFGLTVKETDKSKSSGKINFTFSFKNFNKTFQVEIPTSVKTLEEVTSLLYKASSVYSSKPSVSR